MDGMQVTMVLVVLILVFFAVLNTLALFDIGDAAWFTLKFGRFGRRRTARIQPVEASAWGAGLRMPGWILQL